MRINSKRRSLREQVRQGVSQTFRGHLRATHKTKTNRTEILTFQKRASKQDKERLSVMGGHSQMNKENSTKNVCIVFRGELLRNTQSYYHNNIKQKKIREYDLSEDSFKRQDDIMKSIITHIILPYEENGFNVFISGCVYECPDYYNNLMIYFPKNTIKQIKAGKTNQAEAFYQSLDHAYKEHPDCIEYISLRTDYIMLKDIVRKDLHKLYVGFSWENKNSFPDVDVFFIISKDAMDIFKKILYAIGVGKEYVDTHSIISRLKRVNVHLYPIWNDYKNKATGLTYSDYSKDIKLHENRPFVNYMRIINS